MKKFKGEKVSIELISESTANEKFCACMHTLLEHCMDNPVRQLNCLSLVVSGVPLNQVINGKDMEEELLAKMLMSVSKKLSTLSGMREMQLTETTVEQILNNLNGENNEG